MSIQYDASYKQANPTDLSWSHTVGTGAYKILLVTCAMHAGDNVTAVTFNGISLTKLIEISGNFRRAQIWYLINPPEGTYTVQLTITGGSYNINGGSTSFFGVDQTNPFRATNSTYGASYTPSLSVTSKATDVVVDVISAWLWGSLTPGAGQTANWTNLSGTMRGGSSRENGDDPSTTMSWVGSAGGGDSNFAMCGASLQEAPGFIGEITLPSVDVDAGQNGLIESLPSLAITAGLNGANVTLPIFRTFETFVDVPFKDIIATLPSFVGEGEAKVGTISTATVILPLLQTLSVGSEPYDSTLDAELPIFTINATIITGENYIADIELPILAINATYKTGTISRGILRFPSLQIVGKPVTHVFIDTSLPVFTINGYAHGPLISTLSESLPFFVITAYLQRKQDDFRIYVLNLNNEALTEYKNFNFNSFCTFKGKYLGGNANGIMVLEGSDDDGESISASFNMGITDFRVQNIKKVHDAYISAKGDGSLILTVITDDGLESGYPVNLENTRTKPVKVNIGKGKKGKYWEFSLENVGGSDFEVSEIELNVELLNRRI